MGTLEIAGIRSGGLSATAKSQSAPYDATRLQNWQISELAEENMPTPYEWAERLGLDRNEVIPIGRLCKLDFLRIMERLKSRPDGKYIEVTAITPTPLGEGKSTTSLGLIEGLGKRGKNVGGCLRQPSGGPTMNIKGTAAGGGNALLIPMTEFSMGLTGDINDLMNAHNLAMVALTARLEHERNYDDATLQRLTKMRRLDVDPTRVEMGWVLDYCAQSLRNIIIGMGTSKDGYMIGPPRSRHSPTTTLPDMSSPCIFTIAINWCMPAVE